ncbi:hypothetical protein IEQ34_017802 [Dendrobium chrysotoxum]|uniref:Uncharacterized protein n=1 Tax=Dendrobium chrysotoxum TaxID=161865 RepID=A0AAV7GCN3_DENCH|nr:hypothetical protein IEQ34_017802 [Dendrobium chrysotoxum]
MIVERRPRRHLHRRLSKKFLLHHPPAFQFCTPNKGERTENIKRMALCLTTLTLTAVSDATNGIEELTPFQELCGAFSHSGLCIYR